MYKYSNFKITHTVDRGKIQFPLIVATLDMTKGGSWFRKPVTNSITVYRGCGPWKAQHTGMWVPLELQSWLEAQETLSCIPTD